MEHVQIAAGRPFPHHDHLPSTHFRSPIPPFCSADGTKAIIVQYTRDDDNDGVLSGPGQILYSADGGRNFAVTNAPYRYYIRVDCDADFIMCAVTPNMDPNYDPALMQTSCDGGQSWSEVPGAARGWYDAKVNADGGMMFATDDTWQQTHYVWSYPLRVV